MKGIVKLKPSKYLYVYKIIGNFSLYEKQAFYRDLYTFLKKQYPDVTGIYYVIEGIIITNSSSIFTKEELQLYFVVSKVTLVEETVGTEYENAYVEVKHHEGHKCERCWNYFDELVEIDGHYVCPRCHEVIKDVE